MLVVHKVKTVTCKVPLWYGKEVVRYYLNKNNVNTPAYHSFK